MLQNILVLIFVAALLGQVKRQRSLTLMSVSVLIIYWLQPQTEPANFTFWLPTLTVFLTVITWLLTSDADIYKEKKNWLAGGILLLSMGAIIATRYFDFLKFFAPRPVIFLAVVVVFFMGVLLLAFTTKQQAFWQGTLITLILGIFILTRSSALLDGLINGISVSLGSRLETRPSLQWFGYSYIAFRLLHTVRDRQSRRLPRVTLDEFLSYVLFFPALSAGPIDRIQRFVKDLREPQMLENDDWVEIAKRIFWGLTKKFVLADTLATYAIDPGLVQHLHAPLWMWLAVYAYALQIYFDFSGYTDVAIGIGRLLGVALPENFNAPYLKPNLAQFWNNWHITLTQWFRAYFFNPLTRALRQRKLPTNLVLFFVQMSTMILIGLWHGIQWSFVAWGAWHGLGLFIQNRWSEWMRRTQLQAASPPPSTATGAFFSKERWLEYGGIFLTFNFVSLGWVFFALPTLDLARQAFITLFGVA